MMLVVNSWTVKTYAVCRCVLTVSPGRGLSWASITDILASWSSLLSVWTVLRAESISRGPHASWAFKQHTHTHTQKQGCPCGLSVHYTETTACTASVRHSLVYSIDTFWVAVLSSARQVARFLAHWPSCIAAAWSATVGTADLADVTILLPG